MSDRLRAEARRRGRPAAEVRREFVFQRFLGRVFAEPNSRWVLKGGAGLLIRIQQARDSKDVDLVVPATAFDLTEAVDALRSAVAVDAGDQLTFVVDTVARSTEEHSVALLRVNCFIGARPFERFTIDVSSRSQLVAKVDRIRPRPVIDLIGADPLPRFVLYPLPDQVADKLCAMYSRYGASRGPSTRYRDLVDLVLIITTSHLDASLTSRAITVEAARRGCTLPARITSPGPEWKAGYAHSVRTVPLEAGLRNLDGALVVVGGCLDPVLATSATGTWNPQARRWQG
ncbi:nucleotidyl transferase AbiEii/AbiGii toxin family protein [Kribbella sp. ALI-6-A]|uniref:nucleotidyl transferase AbiEii/AbiGii toxin family protein n=1 Tax=Kribbella sp. ALI-6-A TaxID=1933817 RepID=UPI00143D283D|nr:nucleotidyl transferase AbiEii/AbiGii toxin family protein [Kribbella sp. ALI-6-A]